jgi:hypothetical protein
MVFLVGVIILHQIAVAIAIIIVVVRLFSIIVPVVDVCRRGAKGVKE